MAILMVMKEVSIAQLKAHAPRVVRAVETGEVVVITRRNQPVARLLSCAVAPNQTRLGFDPSVKILGDVTAPVLEAEEWGGLSLE